MKPLMAALVLTASTHAGEAVEDGKWVIQFESPAPAKAVPKVPWNVRAEMLVVHVSLADGLRLMPTLVGPDATPAVNEIHALLSKGKAKLIGAPIQWARSGNRALSESTAGIMYPAHEELWGVQSVRIGVRFDTRSAGINLEYESAVAADGHTIELNIVGQHVTLEGMRGLVPKPAKLGDGVNTLPEFRKAQVTTSITAKSGRWMLIHRSVVDAGHFELFLLRATALPTSP